MLLPLVFTVQVVLGYESKLELLSEKLKLIRSTRNVDLEEYDQEKVQLTVRYHKFGRFFASKPRKFARITRPFQVLAQKIRIFDIHPTVIVSSYCNLLGTTLQYVISNMSILSIKCKT